MKVKIFSASVKKNFFSNIVENIGVFETLYSLLGVQFLQNIIFI